MVEKPQRRWAVFFLDVGKQIIVQSVIHFINVFVSVALNTRMAVHHKHADECAWYFTTFLMDLFPGMVMVYFLKEATESQLRRRGMRKFISGNYALSASEDFNFDCKGYMAETFVWLCIQLTVKLVLLISYKFFLDGISLIGYHLLKIFDFSRTLKLVFVMALFPIFVDVICFLISDSLLTKRVWEADELPLMISYYGHQEFTEGFRMSMELPPRFSGRLVDLPVIVSEQRVR